MAYIEIFFSLGDSVSMGVGGGRGGQAEAPARSRKVWYLATDGLLLGLIALHRRRRSKDGTHDEHPPARDEMRQFIRQSLDVFARLPLEAIHLDDLRDQHIIGLTDRLSGYVRRPRKTPLRDGVQRPADDVAIPRHQTLKVLRQLRRAQLKPDEKGRGSAHPRSVVENRNTTNEMMRAYTVSKSWAHPA
jgi:hypothetical protein